MLGVGRRCARDDDGSNEPDSDGRRQSAPRSDFRLGRIPGVSASGSIEKRARRGFCAVDHDDIGDTAIAIEAVDDFVQRGRVRGGRRGIGEFEQHDTMVMPRTRSRFFVGDLLADQEYAMITAVAQISPMATH